MWAAAASPARQGGSAVHRGRGAVAAAGLGLLFTLLGSQPTADPAKAFLKERLAYGRFGASVVYAGIS